MEANSQNPGVRDQKGCLVRHQQYTVRVNEERQMVSEGTASHLAVPGLVFSMLPPFLPEGKNYPFISSGEN